MLRISGEYYFVNGKTYRKADLEAVRQNIPVLPEGMVAGNYDGERLILSDGANQSEGALPWQHADELIGDNSLESDVENYLNPPQPAPILEEVKARALAKIDAKAEVVRLQYISPGAGQAMVYQEKATEALAYLEDDTPDNAQYPLLMAEVGITGDTIAEVAQVIAANRAAWKQVAGQIENIRLTAKQEVRDAADADAVQDILDGLEWPENPSEE